MPKYDKREHMINRIESRTKVDGVWDKWEIEEIEKLYKWIESADSAIDFYVHGD